MKKRKQYTLQELKKLRSGTDIRGIALENSEYREINLTPDIIRIISYGFAKWLEKKVKRNSYKVAVGIDCRLSGNQLKDAMIDGLTDKGVSVFDCDLATTPAMFMTTVLDSYKCDGAVMITASHLPYYYNGLKFFTKDGGCEKEDIDEILEDAFNMQEEFKVKNKGIVEKRNLIEEYSKILIDKIRKGVSFKEDYEKPLRGNKLIVDAGNGDGGFFAYNVLSELGADISGSQFLDADGRFLNHIPNPEDEDAMNSLKDAVLRNDADLGIIFDTDVDRAAIVDNSGREINKNALIALISAIVLEEHPGSTIVTDSVTSTGLSDFISKIGGVHHRYKRGYKNVINEAIRLNESNEESYLAIETSGHAALKENYFLDDGAYLISKILVKMAKLNREGKKVQDLIKDLKEPAESLSIRLKIYSEDYRKYGLDVIEKLKEYTETVSEFDLVKNNYEGVRVNWHNEKGSGWFLLRLSLHEPLLCLNIESDTEGSAKVLLDKLSSFFYSYSDLEKY